MDNKDLTVLAFDLGASSGRSIIGKLKNNNLELETLYRFENRGIRLFDSFYWNILNLYQEIKTSLSLFVKKYGKNLNSIGIDSWGVDFVLLDENDKIIGLTHHYRDERTRGIIEEMTKVVPKEEIFSQTGIQFMSLNTSTQLFSMVFNNSSQLSIVKSILMIPDYLNYLLSGVKATEYSIATTTQLYNPLKKNWANNLIKKLELQPEWFCKLIEPGTILGTLQDYITDEVGLEKNIKVIAPLCHDTGSAVAAVPVDINKYRTGEWAYLSSGTWSLLGVEVKKPIISKKALKYNLTNEGGIGGTFRFLKNITGLWLIQECKKIWDKENFNFNWEIIEKHIMDAEPFQFFINPDDKLFINPPNMIKAIRQYCKSQYNKVPETIGEISLVIFESLALSYKHVLNIIEDITQREIKILYIIGGGSQNSLLNQFTSNALNLIVNAGPIEATAIGNILVQAQALGKIDNVSELRTIVRSSFPIKEYLPKETNMWEKAYDSFLRIIEP